MSYKINHLHLDKIDSALFLGPLESVIMQIIWDHQPNALTANQILKYVNDFGWTYQTTTITSTLDRLFDKELVTRKLIYDGEQRRRPYRYTPKHKSENVFVLECINVIIERFRELGYIDDDCI